MPKNGIVFNINISINSEIMHDIQIGIPIK